MAVLGIAGACRADEFVNLKNSNIEDKQNFVIVHILNTKNKVSRTFTVMDSSEDNIGYLQILKKYIAVKNKSKIENSKDSRFFMGYRRGKCFNQPVGKNTFYRIPQIIATFLKLPNPERYTGHCFRRTSATLLVNAGMDVLGLKRHGGWKSATIAESYVADSIYQKLETAKKILNASSSESYSSHPLESESGIKVSDSSSCVLDPVRPVPVCDIESNTLMEEDIHKEFATNCAFNCNGDNSLNSLFKGSFSSCSITVNVYNK